MLRLSRPFLRAFLPSFFFLSLLKFQSLHDRLLRDRCEFVIPPEVLYESIYSKVDAVRTSGTTGLGGESIHHTLISLILACDTRLDTVAPWRSGWFSGGLLALGGGGALGTFKWIDPFGGPCKHKNKKLTFFFCTMKFHSKIWKKKNLKCLIK